MNFNRDLKLKIDRFKSDLRAKISLTLIIMAFLISLPAEFICNVRPIVIVVDGKWFFPILFKYSERNFGGTLPSEPDYKSENFQSYLKGELPIKKAITEIDKEGFSLRIDDFEEEMSSSPKELLVLELNDFEDNPITHNETKEILTKKEFPRKPGNIWILWPPVKYDYKYIPTTSKTGIVALASPYKTSSGSSWEDGHYLGTDDRGRDVLARLIYGFRISLLFGLALAITGTILGCLIGGIQGYFGGWIDLIGQRLIEIWSSMPRLYLLIILSSFFVPSVLLLFLILNLTAWMGIAAYIRAEFLKARNLEYVKAAKAMGVSNFKIMRQHILPNSLTPVITFFPFEVTAGILALVSLDYLNLGVPSPAPSIGELLAQGKSNLQATWIILPTFLLLTGTLTLLTFIGDGIRNAFDPRKSVEI